MTLNRDFTGAVIAIGKRAGVAMAIKGQKRVRDMVVTASDVIADWARLSGVRGAGDWVLSTSGALTFGKGDGAGLGIGSGHALFRAFCKSRTVSGAKTHRSPPR